MVLPADGHVHSEWSWDAPAGAMERTCARAVELGLPAVAFTDHADFTTWKVRASDLEQYAFLRPFTDPDGTLRPPSLDVDGYRDCLQRCRALFPGLRIISGVELGEAHWFRDESARLLGAGEFERVLGSLHCLPIGGQLSEMPYLYEQRPAAEVMRDYLAEVARLIESSPVFGVLAHIDYAIRYWPAPAGPFDPYAFEEEFRHALRTLADSGRALEVNTAGVVHPEIVRWWRDEGGEVVTFGSDAHRPDALAQGFIDAAAIAEALGFRPGRHPYDRWTRSG